MKRALYIGRFQPFHNGHYWVVKDLLNKYDELIIMIGSAEAERSFDNPFSSGERIEMIRSCFSLEELSEIIIVPVRDIHDHSRWVSHLKSYVPGFHDVYSNNELVRELFENAGVNAHAIEFLDRKKLEGARIRKMIASGDKEWGKLVPKDVLRFIKEIKGIERIRKLIK